MSRLVNFPKSIAPFGSLIVIGLKKVVENMQFDDIRNMTMSTLKALTKALGHADVGLAVMGAETDRPKEDQ